MRLTMKRTIFLVLIIICFSFYGCSDTETERKEGSTELPDNKDTLSEAVADNISPTCTVESSTSNQPEEEKEMSVTWKLIKTIQPSEKKFSCRMAGFLNNTFGISTAQYGVLNYTADGGETWSRCNNHSDCIAGLEIIDEKNAFITANYSEVRVTNDGGVNWNKIPNYGNMMNEHCRYLSFIDPLTGWIANLKEVGFTKDGGKSWTNIAVPEAIQKISSLWLSSTEEGYILSSDGKLYSTTDGGEAWTEKNLNIQGLSVLVCPTAALNITDNDHIRAIAFIKEKQGFYYFESEDGGNTWNKEELLLEGGEGYINYSRDGKTVTLTEAETKTIRVYELNSQELK